MKKTGLIIIFICALITSNNISFAGSYETALAIESIKQNKPLAYGWKTGASSYLTAIRATNEIIKLTELQRHIPGMERELIEALINKGECCTYFGEHTEAIMTYKSLNRIKDNIPIVHYNLGKSYLVIGNKDEAIYEYEILNRIDPKLAQNLKETINWYISTKK